MKKKLLLTSTVILTAFDFIKAQDEQPATVAKSLLKVNFLAPDLA